jgi:hypothetical protein
MKQEEEETEARHRAEFEAMRQRAAEEGKRKPPRVGMSTEFRTPEAVAEMEQVYGYEAVHGCARPTKQEAKEEEEEEQEEAQKQEEEVVLMEQVVEEVVRAPSTPDADEQLSEESEWLLVSEEADGLSAHSEEPRSEGSPTAAPASPEGEQPPAAAAEEQARVVKGMVGSLGGVALPNAARQEEFRRELRERSLARAVAKTEARDALLDATASHHSEGGDGGEREVQADNVQPLRPSSSRRPVVWGTAQYKSLWQAAMRLGEMQPPETPEEPAEQALEEGSATGGEELEESSEDVVTGPPPHPRDEPAAAVEESTTRGAAAEAVEEVGDVDSDSDDDRYDTDEDPFERNYAVHSVAGQPVAPPRWPRSAPAEPISVEESAVAMSDDEDSDDEDESPHPPVGSTFELAPADVTDVQVEVGAELAEDSDPDGLDELD